MLDGRSAWCFCLVVLLLLSASTSASGAASAASSSAGSGTLRSEEQQDGRHLSLRLHQMSVGSDTSTLARRTLGKPRQLQASQIQRKAATRSEASTAAASSAAASAKVCSYTVRIKTSCSSPRLTRDAISLAFGDARGNEVYAARLDSPSSGTFGRCSTDTFKIQGPCGQATCYLYLRRIGRDGWTPEWVKVTYSSYARDAEFYYGSPLPNAVWYGFNLCSDGRGDG